MPSGLVALLDDVAAITKLAAASLDDIGAATSKAGSKAIGIVVDDTAVTPRYVTGFTPDRELPIIAKIAKGSLRNKLLFLLPGALALSAFAPWAITPLLAAGGAYLCYEAAEKLWEAVAGHDAAEAEAAPVDAAAHEAAMVAGAVRTDLILSAEIMAISLADVADQPLLTQGVVLALVGIAITVGVYGLVGLIVKMDDIGLHLAERGSAGVRAVGRGLVRGMPVLMRGLSVIGTAAMAWVGGGIILHAMEEYGLGALPHWLHGVAEGIGEAGGGGLAEWLINAAGAGVIGLVVGGIIVAVMHLLPRKAH